MKKLKLRNAFTRSVSMGQFQVSYFEKFKGRILVEHYLCCLIQGENLRHFLFASYTVFDGFN